MVIKIQKRDGMIKGRREEKRRKQEKDKKTANGHTHTTTVDKIIQ